jgi:polyisoprenoid-binding protein YceI
LSCRDAAETAQVNSRRCRSRNFIDDAIENRSRLPIVAVFADGPALTFRSVADRVLHHHFDDTLEGEARMRRFLKAAAIAGLFVSPLAAADVKVNLDGKNTEIEWVGTKTDGKHEGGFKRIAGTAVATGDDATTLQLDVTIATNSLFSDDEKLTAHLKAPDFFDVKRYPKATFKSTKVEKADKGYKVTGDLTLLGKTKSISFPAEIAVAGGNLDLDAEFKIDRTAFGMNYGEGKIDKEVALDVDIDSKAD